jgi:hypothetical protein
VAGVQVAQALKLLCAAAQLTADAAAEVEWNKNTVGRELCPDVYCRRAPTQRGMHLEPIAPEGPNAGCYVCGGSQLTLEVDLSQTTLGFVVEKVGSVID